MKLSSGFKTKTQEEEYNKNLYGIIFLMQYTISKIITGSNKSEISISELFDESLFIQHFRALYSKLSSIEKGKKSPPKFSFAFQNIRNKIKEKTFGKTSARLSSGSRSSKYPEISQEKYASNSRERKPSMINPNSSGFLKQAPAVDISKKNKRKIHEGYMNQSTELPMSSNGHYSNMDIIIESEGPEENMSSTSTPKGSFWGNKSHETIDQRKVRKSTRNTQKFFLPKSKIGKMPQIKNNYRKNNLANNHFSIPSSDSMIRPELEYSTMSEDNGYFPSGVGSIRNENLDYISRSSNSRSGPRKPKVKGYMEKSISATKILGKKRQSKGMMPELRQTPTSKLSQYNDASSVSQSSISKYDMNKSQHILNKVAKYL
ncbi:unnamed protein product [Moneuplotes crassus]|uniref:Uncharacterized protein n=1 Tax=Euplotes crassus TaxID=5936 RepID=A0AAD1XH80_EUPCR|nr:unnamed protein product [Moneuplotes crassus]